MSAQPLPPPQGASEGESDSEYLNTPVDPPNTVQPHVAEYGPLGDYYCAPATFQSAGYAAVGHPVPQYRYSDSNAIETSTHSNLLFGQVYYEPAIQDACARTDSTMPAYHWMAAGQVVPSPSSDRSSSSPNNGLADSPRDDSSPSLAPASAHVGIARLRCAPASLQYPEYDGEPGVYGDIVPNVSSYAIARSRQPDLVCNTNVGYSLAGNQRSHSSPDHTVLPAAASFPSSTYFDEGYSESPIEGDSLHHDPFINSGCAVERSCGYDGQSQPCPPHLDAHLPAAHMPIRHSVRFYQPPSCPYSYPLIDGPADGSGYGSEALSALYPHSVIHAPRPQQLHGLHSLHGGPCSAENAPSLMPSHQVLSIPNGPMQPLPRPSSLIEDNPKKPLTLACYFCRKRKIACQSPPASSPDRTCNQCAKRKLKCVYPATSRRGIRPRVYDLQDDHLPRTSAPLSL